MEICIKGRGYRSQAHFAPAYTQSCNTSLHCTQTTNCAVRWIFVPITCDVTGSENTSYVFPCQRFDSAPVISFTSISISGDSRSMVTRCLLDNDGWAIPIRMKRSVQSHEGSQV